MKNSARIHCFDDLDSLELLIADFSDHEFERHWHDTWSVGVVLRGANNNSAQRKMEGIVQCGEVSIIAPGEVHAGTVVGEQGCRYFMFYPKVESVFNTAESMEMHLPPNIVAGLKQTVFAKKLCEAATVLTNIDADKFERDVVWTNCMAEFLHVFSSVGVQNITNQKISVSSYLIRAKEYLHDYQLEGISLDRLAQAAGMSKFHLCRQFTAKFGLSPSRYQRQLKLLQVKRMLSAGRDIAEIAVSCGFSDQSHLGRAFKSTYGTTPRNYRNFSR